MDLADIRAAAEAEIRVASRLISSVEKERKRRGDWSSPWAVLADGLVLESASAHLDHATAILAKAA